MAQRAFEAAGFARQRRATFCVDLTQTPETLWERLKPAARKNLRKLMAAEELVVSPLETESDLEAYWQMLRETHRRDDRALAYRSLEDLAESFWRRPHALGLLRGILVRTREGAPVAGLLYRYYNGWIQELGVAYTDFSLQQKIYGQDLIKWEIIRQGQLQGARRYDLMGVEVDSPDPKKRGIYQFKEKWGGQLVEFGVYNKTYSSWKAELLRCGTSVARRLRGRARERG
jgi:lipid II:glycine glycyltransferase (peptidoglycan interpeptide bridge formation enzyme)